MAIFNSYFTRGYLDVFSVSFWKKLRVMLYDSHVIDDLPIEAMTPCCPVLAESWFISNGDTWVSKPIVSCLFWGMNIQNFQLFWGSLKGIKLITTSYNQLFGSSKILAKLQDTHVRTPKKLAQSQCCLQFLTRGRGAMSRKRGFFASMALKCHQTLRKNGDYPPQFSM